MSKDKMPAVELFENLRELESALSGWNVPVALYAEVEALQSYAEKVTEKLDRAVELLEAVKSTEFRGIYITDVGGQNWFDLREDFLKSLKEKD